METTTVVLDHSALALHHHDFFVGDEGSSIPTLGMALIFMTVLGSVVGNQKFASIIQKPAATLLTVAVLTTVLFAWAITEPNTRPTSADSFRTPLTIAFGIIGTFSGCTAAISWLSLVYKKFRISGLETIGRYLLQIYLLHLIVVSPIRIFLTKTGIDNPIAINFTATVLGVTVPILFALFCKKIKFNYLFEVPSPAHKPKHSWGSNHHV